MTTQDVSDGDAIAMLVRARLDRAARDLAEHREPVRGDAGEGSLAALVAARDAQLWATIDSLGSAHE